jgi:hypothetical protein
VNTRIGEGARALRQFASGLLWLHRSDIDTLVATGKFGKATPPQSFSVDQGAVSRAGFAAAL